MNSNKPPTNNEKRRLQEQAENALGIVGASGYFPEVYRARNLSQGTRKGLLANVNTLQAFPGGKIRLQAAAKSGNLEEVQRILHQLTRSKTPKAQKILYDQISKDLNKELSPITLAELNGHEQIVREFFNLGLKSPTENDYMFLLQGALQSNNQELVRNLLFHGDERFPYLLLYKTNNQGVKKSSAPADENARFLLINAVFNHIYYQYRNDVRVNRVAIAQTLVSMLREILPTEAYQNDVLTTVLRFLFEEHSQESIQILQQMFREIPQLYTRFAGKLVGRDQGFQYLPRPSSGPFFNLVADEFYTSQLYTPRDEWYNTALEQILLDGFRQGVNVNIIVHGRSALEHFIYAKSDAIVEFLLLQSPNLDLSLNESGAKALYIAVNRHLEGIVKVLVEKGVGDYRDFSRHSTLGTAVSFAGRADSLVRKRIFLSSRNNEDNSNNEDRLEEIEDQTLTNRILDLLLDHIDNGFDINEREPRNMTPLMFAVESGSLATVQKVLAIPGVKVNEREKRYNENGNELGDGRTALFFLMHAFEAELIEPEDKETIQGIFRALLNAGADPTLQHKGRTALEYYTHFIEEGGDDPGYYYEFWNYTPALPFIQEVLGEQEGGKRKHRKTRKAKKVRANKTKRV